MVVILNVFLFIYLKGRRGRIYVAHLILFEIKISLQTINMQVWKGVGWKQAIFESSLKYSYLLTFHSCLLYVLVFNFLLVFAKLSIFMNISERYRKTTRRLKSVKFGRCVPSTVHNKINVVGSSIMKIEC